MLDNAAKPTVNGDATTNGHGNDVDAMQIVVNEQETTTADTSSHPPPPQLQDDYDPLDAFMLDVTSQVQKLDQQDLEKEEEEQLKAAASAESLLSGGGGGGMSVKKMDASDDEGDVANSDNEDIMVTAAKRVAAKRKDIAPADHASITYLAFKRDFFVEPPEFADMTEEEVDARRIELDGIKIRGLDCPKPCERWTQFGLPMVVNDVIRKILKYEKPSSVQAQAIPAILSGRDVIGIAKTGSGKTLAFLLPMLRHIMDQPVLGPSDGPIALVMTPTRELAVQIHKECKPFAKALGLRACCAYGGSPIKDQIADLKRGAEIVICTPGRMIDLLCANSGRVTNLRRVSYLVLDEADRMFDMGFEPQVMKIVNNVQPGRQTALFSATFPRQMEALARKILKRPLEIIVGGRSVVCADVTQVVEVREEDTKFLRLLEIMGNAMESDPETKVLIFVDRHEAADNILHDLLRRGYPCQSLHGGKDQMDRDSAIADFKSGDTNILIATSVAARGLDVKLLKIVVNYECPNHMEDYVHRVGRTGRAGNKGTAYTFITPEQGRYAVDIEKALLSSNVEIPDDLRNLCISFMEKLGGAKLTSSGFGGKGLERLDQERDTMKKIQKKTHSGGADDEAEEEEAADATALEDALEAKIDASMKSGGAGTSTAATAVVAQDSAAMQKIQDMVEKINSAVPTNTARVIDKLRESLKSGGGASVKLVPAAPTATSASTSATGADAASTTASVKEVFTLEIEINDFPQKARWKVTNKEQIASITENSGAAITTRGSYYGPGKQPGLNDRKLYLFIEGESKMIIDKARSEIKDILLEATVASMQSEAQAGRYSVI